MTVELCRHDGRYQVGQPLEASWRIGKDTVQEAVGVEASVLWYTEGKGDEDLQVHHFQRWNDAQLQQIDLRQPQAIQCVLPLSPVSYQGTLVRICWCVRVRLFRTGNRESLTQQPFYLVGEVPALSYSGNATADGD